MFEKSPLDATAARAQKQTAYAMTATESCAVEQSAVGCATAALANARDLAYRAMQLVDRIVGCVPQSGEAAGSKPPNLDGVFPILRLDSEHTTAVLRDAQSALDRLEGSLP